MKKYLILLLAAVCVMFVFAACSGSAAPGAAEPTAAPVEVEPTATPAATATPEPAPEPDLGPTPEPEIHFDDLVAQYEAENGIDLNTSDYSYQWDFFSGLYEQDYTRTNGLNDVSITSEENKELLDLYINKYFADLHDSCEFDDAVDEFLAANPDADISQNPTPLFMHLLEKGLEPYYLQETGCDNEYVSLFLKWYFNGGTL